MRIKQVVGHKSFYGEEGRKGENTGEEDLILTRVGTSREHTVVSVGGTWSRYIRIADRGKLSFMWRYRVSDQNH
jgi:hypothetical protein